MGCLVVVVSLGVLFGAIWDLMRLITRDFIVPIVLDALAQNIEGRR